MVLMVIKGDGSFLVVLMVIRGDGNCFAGGKKRL